MEQIDAADQLDSKLKAALVDFVTGMSSCVEMLARWDHSEWEIFPPSQFINLIERAGWIDQFTDSLLRQS